MDGKKFDLVQGLNLPATLSLVIGTIIGTGVFLKTATMTQAMGSPLGVMIVWVVAGLLSMTGAFCFAELASRYPEAGGEYVFLRKAFGELPAFLNGWMRFCIGGPGSIAAYAVALMTFLNSVVTLPEMARTFGAVLVVTAFTLANCATVRAAGFLQTGMAVCKLSLILALTGLIFVYAPAGQMATGLFNGGFQFPGWKAFGVSMLASLWAYDGWNGMPMASSEVSNPTKNIPRALVFGMLGVMAIYLLANLAFFAALPMAEIKTSNSYLYPNALPVATKAAAAALGQPAVIIVSLILAFSAVVSLNGSVLTGARVPFAMARDGLLFPALARIHTKTRTPVVSVLIQGAIAIVLACSGTFDQLTNYVLFASWVFYFLAISALFVLRKKDPTPLAYRVPGYPWVPLAFLGVSGWLVINTLLTSPKESLIGALIIGAGVPLFYHFRRKNP